VGISIWTFQSLGGEVVAEDLASAGEAGEGEVEDRVKGEREG
jgi:hypothetical protein